ncbi:hypothetical protein GQX74_005921 [Glossina fuscipes]|nr:hypothetical protein GQX74_005921 [Glossina fuscipes]
MIALGERFEDIPAPATAPPRRETTVIRQQPGGNAPFMTSTTNAGRNVCHRCALPGHLARDCRNPRVLFCWDCGRQGVLTKNCCRQNTEQHPQARGMTAKESPGLEKPRTVATSKVLGMRGSTLVASLSVGGLPTTGVIDTGATRSIIREDAAECIPWLIRSDTKSHSIRMADGTTQDSLRTLTVETRLGVKAATLELLVVKRGVDHLTLGMDFLAEIGTVVTIADEVIKLSRRTNTPPSKEKIPMHNQCPPTGEHPSGDGQRANGNPGDRQRQSHAATENQPVSRAPTGPSPPGLSLSIPENRASDSQRKIAPPAGAAQPSGRKEMPDHPYLRASPLAPMDCGSPRSHGRSQRDICHRLTRKLSDRGDSFTHPTLHPTPKPGEARPGYSLRLAIIAAAKGPSPAAGQPARLWRVPTPEPRGIPTAR